MVFTVLQNYVATEAEKVSIKNKIASQMHPLFVGGEEI